MSVKTHDKIVKQNKIDPFVDSGSRVQINNWYKGNNCLKYISSQNSCAYMLCLLVSPLDLFSITISRESPTRLDRHLSLSLSLALSLYSCVLFTFLFFLFSLPPHVIVFVVVSM